MNGGDGSDIYIVDNVGDVAAESFNDALSGVDLVKSSVTHALGFGIENLTLTGVANINGTGNGNNNVITGNLLDNVLSGLGGYDTLKGGEGNDTLIGGLGKDTLNGGLGNDRFDYDSVNESPAGLGKDKIVGFAGNGVLAGDQIDLITIDANPFLAGNQAFIFGGPFTTGHLQYVGGVLQGNTDADAAAEFQITLLGAPALFVNPASAGTDVLL